MSDISISTTATGFVLAGGGSTRMGRDKALLPWGETTLLDHALARLRAACAQVAILSGSETRYTDCGVPVHPDVVPDAGPLGGVLTGLRAMSGEIGLYLAVDLPFVPPAFLRHLLELAPGHDAVVPVVNGRPEPVCAVYRRSCTAPIQQRLVRGERAMWSFWPDVRLHRVEETEIARYGGSDILRNLNTPEEYRAHRESNAR